MEHLSIALSPDLVAALQAAVDEGDYESVSEAVREVLLDWRLRREVETMETEDLRRMVQEGVDSGPGLDAGEVFARLRAKHGQPPAA